MEIVCLLLGVPIGFVGAGVLVRTPRSLARLLLHTESLRRTRAQFRVRNDLKVKRLETVVVAFVALAEVLVIVTVLATVVLVVSGNEPSMLPTALARDFMYAIIGFGIGAGLAFCVRRLLRTILYRAVRNARKLPGRN